MSDTTEILTEQIETVVILTESAQGPMGPAGGGASAPYQITASEALAAGDYVNIWSSSGAKVRKANATTEGKEAMGFVLAAVLNGGSATVYPSGMNTAVTAQVPGRVFLSTTAGQGASTPPATAGNSVQSIGTAVSATVVNVNFGQPIILA